MGWVRIDRRYNNPYRLTRHAKRVITAWVVAGIVTLALVNATHGWFAIPAGVAVAGYMPWPWARSGWSAATRRSGSVRSATPPRPATPEQGLVPG